MIIIPPDLIAQFEGGVRRGTCGPLKLFKFLKTVYIRQFERDIEKASNDP